MWRVQCRLPSPVAEALRGTLAGCPQRFSSARETLPPRSRVAPAGVEADPDSSAPPTSQAAHRPRAAASTPDATPRGSRATARCVPLLPARLPLHRRRPDPRAFGNVPPAPPPDAPSLPRRRRCTHGPFPPSPTSPTAAPPPTHTPSTTSPPAWRATDPLPSCTPPPPTARRSGSSPPASTPVRSPSRVSTRRASGTRWARLSSPRTRTTRARVRPHS